MGERRFVIAELVGNDEVGKPLFAGRGIGITESELKRRLFAIAVLLADTDGAYLTAIHILLNGGEGK